MEPISRQDVEKIMQWGKSLSEEQCTRLLDHFENYQGQLYNAIYGELSDAIAAVNLDMANLFLDLCFDIFLIYNWVEGDIPREPEDKQWLRSKMALLDAELKSLSPESAMDTKLSAALNERFVARCKESGTSLGLLSCLNDEVHRYASFNPARVPAISLTNNLLFVVVRMMDSVYEYQPESLASLPEESISTLSHINRAGKTYFLYQGVTRTGKPRFYFSSKEKTEAESVHSIPEGYEIYERPESGQVFLRKAMPRLISEDEQQCIASALSALKEPFCYVMDCQKQYVTIFESAAVGTAKEMKNTEWLRKPSPDQLAQMARQSHFLPVLRFELVDKKKRQFRAQRFCFMGRIETWMSLDDRGKLHALASQYIPLLGTDELYQVPFGFMG